MLYHKVLRRPEYFLLFQEFRPQGYVPRLLCGEFQYHSPGSSSSKTYCFASWYSQEFGDIRIRSSLIRVTERMHPSVD